MSPLVAPPDPYHPPGVGFIFLDPDCLEWLAYHTHCFVEICLQITLYFTMIHQNDDLFYDFILHMQLTTYIFYLASEVHRYVIIVVYRTK